MKIHLRRFAESPDGTFGRLKGPGLSLYTLEDEWVGNRPNVSRIPAGIYLCARAVFHRGGYETFEVIGVPNRSHILFHVGNTEEDTEGCILLGTSMGPLEVTDEDSGERRPKLAVLGSRDAFDRFMNQLRGLDEFDLRITDPEWSI